ncbi:DUF5818 domain-containing protein [uncultured Sphingomonas sp.]|uniref:DUF5818 domain-containing protein n=1 Tax=uncultured Sphingomonas sp. TaxID=158754 RepID=UPI00258B9D6B|nr:DUF5818 domain-containing protein [uncultured Sphingomonas sp.]
MHASDEAAGDRGICESGLLVRDGAAFVLRRDAGGVYRLDLPRVPVDHVQKRVRITGVLEADGRVTVEGVAPA